MQEYKLSRNEIIVNSYILYLIILYIRRYQSYIFEWNRKIPARQLKKKKENFKERRIVNVK